MSPCVTVGNMHINFAGKQKEILRRSEGIKWCFVCRKRREFFFVVTADVEPSYYEPNPNVECSVCKTSDGDCFPGKSREWE